MVNVGYAYAKEVTAFTIRYVFRDENDTRGAPAETTKNRGPPMIKNNDYIRDVLGARSETAETAENSHPCVLNGHVKHMFTMPLGECYRHLACTRAISSN